MPILIVGVNFEVDSICGVFGCQSLLQNWGDGLNVGISIGSPQ